MTVQFMVRQPSGRVADTGLAADLATLAQAAALYEHNSQEWQESLRTFAYNRLPNVLDLGFVREPVPESVEFANVNALGFIRLLKLQDFAEYYNGNYNLYVGTVPAENCSQVLARIERMLNTHEYRAIERADQDYGNWFECGMSLRYIQDKLTALKNLFASAVTAQTDVMWG